MLVPPRAVPTEYVICTLLTSSVQSDARTTAGSSSERFGIWYTRHPDPSVEAARFDCGEGVLSSKITHPELVLKAESLTRVCCGMKDGAEWSSLFRRFRKMPGIRMGFKPHFHSTFRNSSFLENSLSLISGCS